MAVEDSLLSIANSATTLGNSISLKMVDFLNQVKDQPAGFRDLGLEFLGICHILNSLRESLKSHFDSKQPFPAKAIPELTRVLSGTMQDFDHLQTLLHKFMEFEKGGTFAMLQKTWRLVFADKDIAKIRNSLQANKGALRMTMLLVDITPMPTTAPPTYEYGMLAAKLEHEESTVNATPLPLASSASQAQDFKSSQHDTAFTPISSSSDVNLTPSVSEMSISDQKPGTSTAGPLGPPKIEHHTAVDVPVHSIDEPETKYAPEKEVDKGALPSGEPLRTLIDRSKIQKRIPKSSLGLNNAALTKTLITAVAAHKHNIVEQLLDRGVSPDTGPEKNVLLNTVYERDIESLKILLEFGADPNAKDNHGNTPLRCACEYNHEDEARILLEYGADPNISAPDWTPLPWALNHNSESLAHLLLQYGANPDLVMENGWTSLMYACEKNRLPSIVQDFFTYGASPDIPDARGNTALGIACYRNHPDLVQVLLSNGANPHLPGQELPMLVSVRYPACLEHFIAVCAHHHCSKGIMERATHFNCIEAVKLLLDAGLDPNEKYEETYSPLATAIQNNQVEILGLLLSRGADPNELGQAVPLISASRFADPERLRLLLDAKADVNKQYNGQTALMEACNYNTIENVKMLLERGARQDIVDDGGDTAMDIAAGKGHDEIVMLLLEAMA